MLNRRSDRRRRDAGLRRAAAAAAAPASPSGADDQTSGAAQTPQRTAPAAQPSESMCETRPATTTFMGDTGLWNVPTGEVLPAKRWSVSAYRVNFDDNQGFTDVSQLAGHLRRSASATARRSSASLDARHAASTATSVRCSFRRYAAGRRRRADSTR